MAEIAWHFKLTKKNFMHLKHWELNQQFYYTENCQYHDQKTYSTIQKISKNYKIFQQ